MRRERLAEHVVVPTTLYTYIPPANPRHGCLYPTTWCMHVQRLGVFFSLTLIRTQTNKQTMQSHAHTHAHQARALGVGGACEGCPRDIL